MYGCKSVKLIRFEITIYFFTFIKNCQKVYIDIRARTDHDDIPMKAFCPIDTIWFYPQGNHVIIKFPNKEPQGKRTRAEESSACCRMLRSHFKSSIPNQTCVKLYRSSLLSMESVAEKWMRSWARVFLGYSRVRIPRSAMRMPEIAVGRSRMQLRAFNEVSRLAARCDAVHGCSRFI